MVELLIENVAVDLYPSEVISLTMSINDMASIESREGNYSNKFTVPSTAKNNSILGYPNELNFVTGFKPTKSRNASITIDGLEVQRGTVQVEQFNHAANEFSISFASGNTEWMDELGDKRLRDMNLSNLNHTWNSANVVSSLSNTEGYIYPFIHYGRYEAVASNDTDLINWLPAMFTHTLIRKMFADVDWKVGGNIFNDPIFLKHIIPFSIKEIELNKEEYDLLGFSSEITSTITPYVGGDTIVYDNVSDGNSLGSYNSSTGVYTASSTFQAEIFAQVTTDPLMSGTDRLQVRLNGFVVADSKTVYVDTTTLITSGDTVTITINNNKNFLNSKSSNFILNSTGKVVEGMNMPMSSTLPDMSQEALLQTVFNQFGVVFTSDNVSKTVYLNKFEKVKDNIVNAVDWTDKIDNSKEIEYDYTELVSGYAKVNTLGYKENTDADVNNNYASVVRPFIGNGSFSIDNDFLSKEEELFESDFVSSESILTFNNRARLMYIPRYTDGSVDEINPDITPKPRCAICVNDISIGDLFSNDITSINVVGSTGTTNTTVVPYPYFNISRTGIDEIDSINLCLSFGDNVTPKVHRNLIEANYKDFIDILNNPRRITAYFLLNERDINNLDFLIPRYLGGELNNYFYINKISDYRPISGGVAKVELILIV